MRIPNKQTFIIEFGINWSSEFMDVTVSSAMDPIYWLFERSSFHDLNEKKRKKKKERIHFE